ncbi:MAG: DUF58 domain-containing protein [Rhodocyclales bacterium]|nr:DUF58 domain-containing protein [Rhodocyclales bacterium]
MISRGAAPWREGLERWQRRRAAASAGTFTVTHRTLYILPTAAGAGFALTLFVLWLLAINYSLSLGHALVFWLAAVAVMAIPATAANLRGVAIDVGEPEAVFAGERLRWPVMLRAGAPRFRPLELTAPGAQAVALLTPSLGSVRVFLEQNAERRGLVRLGRLRVATRHPFGWFRAWTLLWPTTSAWIYPRPEPQAPPWPAAASLAEETGALSQGIRPGEEDFADLRPWRAGEPLRRVLWKIVARGGPRMLSRREGPAAGTVLLRWNDTLGAGDVEARLSRLCAWVLAAHHQHLAFGVELPDGVLPPDRGEAHLHAVLRRLALFPPEAA